MESFSILTTTLLGTLVLFAAFIFHRWRKEYHYKYPKGPKSFPLLGNLHQMVKTPAHIKFSQWADEFGPIYTIKFGSRNVVVVNELNLMRELFSIYPASTGRYNPDAFTLPYQGLYGFGVIGGSEWLEQRQFCVKSLRQFGFGKGSTMDSILCHEADQLVNCCATQSTSGPVHLTDMLQRSSFNTLWVLVTGETISPGDTTFSSIMKNWMDALQYAVTTGLLFLPWLKYVSPKLSGFNGVNQAGYELNSYVRKCFERHQLQYTEGYTPSTLLEAYLEKLSTETDPKSTFYGEEGWKQCLGSVVVLFIGGGETTSSTLEWIIFYLSVHQQVQDKVWQEIEQVIGTGNVCLGDRLKMPYTEAVILESFRRSSLVPFGVIHELSEDIQFKEYTMSKGTLLVANMYHVHNSLEIWGDPFTFRPERFLEESSGTLLKENVIPFQVGRRQCMGERLARDIIFIFLVKLLQQFTFEPDPTVENVQVYMEPVVGFFLMPKPLKVLAKPRE